MCYTKIGDSRKKCFISKPVSVFHLSRTLIIKWCKKKPISKCTKIYGILRSFKNAVILRLRLLSGHVIRSMKKNHLSYANKILSVIFVSFLIYLFLGKNNLWPFTQARKEGKSVKPWKFPPEKISLKKCLRLLRQISFVKTDSGKIFHRGKQRRVHLPKKLTSSLI